MIMVSPREERMKNWEIMAAESDVRVAYASMVVWNKLRFRG